MAIRGLLPVAVLGMRGARPSNVHALPSSARRPPAQLLVAFAAPIAQAVLLLRLSRPSHAARSPELGLNPITKSGAWRGEMKILCVDDSPSIQDMLVATLTRAGWDILQAADGKAALRLLESENVDVIISDVNMIVMGGFEFVSKVRQDPVHQFTPILFLTAEDNEDFKEISREVGATGWLCTPFDPAELIGVLRRISYLI